MPTFLRRYPKTRAVFSSVVQNSASMEVGKRKRKAGNKGREKEGGKKVVRERGGIDFQSINYLNFYLKGKKKEQIITKK